ncbi:3-dehydroquinate synthase [Maritalea myrionectae]|uniref:3-dehydroquinate synthase n=1 Tax=Maritalea myrionectae TaxID=454601 RepID=A0A2R4MAS7_9HYPH|nr:3-dehydroquinate synthase [Maritalea myrionectae]AVX03131.1 3-dehydroquinate synthase [Maritalea myrionectae]
MSTENALKPIIVPIDLGDRAYDIEIAPDVLDRLGGILTEKFPGARFGVVTDLNVEKNQWARLQKSLEAHGLNYALISIPPGENAKSMARLDSVVFALLKEKLERNDIVLAFGGGVIGDLAGFAAAIMRRGMDFVQIPTSLLAQVDSSVGGKTGVNSPHGKNLIGAFHQPRFVAADLGVLETLSERHFRAGYAEVVKYGLIDDEEFFFWLEENQPEIFAGGPARAEAIARACRAKARVVVADEREMGQRALLNLGHTFGHALESATGYSDRLIHGEGVAIGMALAHRFSTKLGLSNAQDDARVVAHLKKAGLPTNLSDIPGDLPPTADLLDLIAQDKKVSRGALTFILTKGIGKAFIEKNVNPDQVFEFLNEERQK